MLDHFGHEVHAHHKQFNILLSELSKLCNDTNQVLFTLLPLRKLFLADYSDLEKLLVLINLALFGACMCAGDDVDPNVATVIIYFFFAIAYFMTTSVCLSGANSLKRQIMPSSLFSNSQADIQDGNSALATERSTKSNSTSTNTIAVKVHPYSSKKSAKRG